MSVFAAFWFGVFCAAVGGVILYRENKWPGSTRKLLDRFRK